MENLPRTSAEVVKIEGDSIERDTEAGSEGRGVQH